MSNRIQFGALSNEALDFLTGFNNMSIVSEDNKFNWREE